MNLPPKIFYKKCSSENDKKMSRKLFGSGFFFKKGLRGLPF